MTNTKNKLALGTVQFGVDYGISNKNGKVSFDKIEEILDFARSIGLYTLDTAHLYGYSEETLGKFNLEDFDVITKTTKIDYSLDKNENFENFKETFYLSQKRLGYIQLHGLMFHESNDLLSDWGHTLWNLLEDFKQKEYVRKIGVSVYNPKQLEEILDIVDIDIVQLPLNIFDQRFIPMLPELKKRNIEVHTRSTFLQGLLFMDTHSLNPFFEPIKPIIEKLPDNRLEIALNFVNQIKEVDKIVVGVTKKEELQQIIDAIETKIEPINFDGFIIKDERFILPQNWRLE